MVTSAGPQRLGIETFIGSDAFDKGMNKYVSGLSSMEKSTDKTAAKLSGGGGLNAALTAGAGAMGGISMGALALGSALGGVLFTGLQKVYGMLSQYLSLMQGVNLAARVQELDYVVQIMGQNAGLTNVQLQEQIATITQLGIRQDEARSSLIQFMQAQLDLSKAGELARAAQDLAVVGAMDSSEAYNRLIYAITRTDTQMLRTIGVNIMADQAYDKFAKTLGKTAGELTTTERQAAFLNAVLDESKKYAGAYEAAMYSASKQLRSLTGRELPELMMALGQPLMNAFYNIVKGARELVQGFTALIKEGGPLRDILINIGGAADLITEPFLNAATAFKNAVTEFAKSGTGPIADMIQWFKDKFGKLITDASAWGTNLITSFAEGMVAGMVAVINVLAHLGSIIASWLVGHSPPKIVPDIEDYGRQLMESYYKGVGNRAADPGQWERLGVTVSKGIKKVTSIISNTFAKIADVKGLGAEMLTNLMAGWKSADLSVFKDIASTIQGYLGSLVGNKPEDKAGMIQSMLGSREAITDAINTVREAGAVTESAVMKVVKASGIGTAAFKNYVTAMLQSEVAAKKVKDIQDQMTAAATKWDTQLQALYKDLNKLTEGAGEQERLGEISTAISTGLLTKEEKARLEAEKRTIELKQQIRTVETARDVELGAMNERLMAAQKEMDMNAENLSIQKELLGIQQEQNDLFKQYLAAQEAVAKEAAAKEAVAKAARGAGGLDDLLGAGAGAGLGAGIEDALRTAIENAKNALKTKLAEMWATLKEDFKAKFPELFEAWEGLKEKWDPIFLALKDWWINDVQPAWASVVAYWNDTLSPALSDLWDWFVTKGIPAVEDLAKSMIWMVNSGMVEIKRYWDEELHPSLNEFWLWITEEGVPAVENITAKVIGWVVEGFQKLYNFWIEYISPFFTTMNKFINNDLKPTILKITELFVAFRETGLRLLHELWVESIQPMLRDLHDWFDTKIMPKLQPIIDGFNAWKEAWKKIGEIWFGTLAKVFEALFKAISDNNVPYEKFVIITKNLRDFIQGIPGKLKDIRDQIDKWIDAMKNWHLPKWMERGSPSPFENTLMGITKLMKELNANIVPEFNNNLREMNVASRKNGVAAGATNVTNNNYYRNTNLTMNPQYSQYQSPSSVYWDASAALSAAKV